VDTDVLRGFGRAAVGGGDGVDMAVVAIIVDGKWTAIDDGRNEIDTPSSDIDRILNHLAQVVRLAQGLPDDDQRRTRDFVRAALATLEATTSLPKADQRKFNKLLSRGD
jgi:hypothetical protein